MKPRTVYVSDELWARVLECSRETESTAANTVRVALETYLSYQLVMEEDVK